MATNPIEQLTETNEVPAGGYTWDGRYNSLHAQAMLPLFSPVEMDNRDAKTLAGKLSRAAYAGEFQNAVWRAGFSSIRRWRCGRRRRRSGVRAAGPEFSSLFQQVRSVAGRQGEADGAGAAWASSCSTIRTGETARRATWTKWARTGRIRCLRIFSLRRWGCRATRRFPGTTIAHYYDLGLCGPLSHGCGEPQSFVLRAVPDAVAAECGDSAGFLS